MFDWLTPELGQILEGVSGVFTAVVGGLAIWYAALQLRSENQRSRAEWATQLFAQHLERSIEFPNFATPDLEKIRAAGNYEHYQWFVGLMLFTMEAVVSAFPRNRVWRNRVETQLRFHEEYLMSADCQARFLNRINRTLAHIITQATNQ